MTDAAELVALIRDEARRARLEHREPLGITITEDELEAIEGYTLTLYWPRRRLVNERTMIRFDGVPLQVVPREHNLTQYSDEKGNR